MGNAASEHEKKGKPAGSVPQRSDPEPVLEPALRTDQPLSQQKEKEDLASPALSKSDEEVEDTANHEHSMEEDKDQLRTSRPLSEQEKKEGLSKEEEEEEEKANQKLSESLYWAAYIGNSLEEVRALIGKGAKIDFQEESGQTPLFKASERGHIDVVGLLLFHQADPNIADKWGQTPLYIASSRGLSNVVSLLLSHRANPNITNNDGETPLYTASDEGHIDVVSILLSHRADPNITDSGGKTPLYAASERRYSDVVSLLQSYQANPSITDEDLKQKDKDNDWLGSIQ